VAYLWCWRRRRWGPSSGLTYDAYTDSYTYVWKTNKDWMGCRQLVLKLNDGKEYRANFKLIK
jgi:hypothetical protein